MWITLWRRWNLFKSAQADDQADEMQANGHDSSMIEVNDAHLLDGARQQLPLKRLAIR